MSVVDHDAERAVLGSLLLDPSCAGIIVPTLEADMFDLAAHRTIFDAMASLHAEGRALDFVTLYNALDRRGQLETLAPDDPALPAGRGYPLALVAMTPTATHAEHYAGIVRDLARRRALIAAGQRVQQVGDDTAVSLDEAMARANAAMTEATAGAVDTEAVLLGAVLGGTLDEMETPASERRGVPTGFYDFDRLTGGLQPGQLTVLAARPSVGKSAWALQVVRAAAVLGGHPCCYVGLEMTPRDVARRLIAVDASVSLQHIVLGEMDQDEWDAVTQAAARLEHAPLHLSARIEHTIDAGRALVERIHRQTPLALVVVDYLQLFDGGGAAHGHREENRVQEVSRISRSLKALAHDLDVPVLALSQLSRGVESRPSKRPLLSDLRDSGALEQDADLVLFLYRASMYEDGAAETDAEVIVAKNRNGPLATVPLHWFGERAMFANVVRGEGR